MPELPEVQTVVNSLQSTLPGKTIKSVHCPNNYKGVFENLTTDSLTQKIQDWVNDLKINFDLIEKKINFDEFIKIYYLEDNQCMRDNTYYQPTELDLKMLLKTLWN